MLKQWKLQQADEQSVEALHSSLGINKSICNILVNRGITNFEQARQYFRITDLQFHDPFLMKDMDKAVRRLLTAISNKEKIMIYGDYDVDGTTSVAVLYSYLKLYTDNVIYYVPHRFKEGYGVSQQGLQFAQEQNVNLLITIDCGIKSSKLLNDIQVKGIDVIICDHHLPDESIPKVTAILNPKQKDCEYPFDELCGCAIGYKLICALEGELDNKEKNTTQFLDLVATAIAADIVPMVNENRVLAYLGVKRANEDPCLALKVLKEIGSLKDNFTITDLVFVIAPRVNAAGRMDDAYKAIKLFISKDHNEAMQLAKELNTDNSDRREVDKMITEEAIKLLEAEDPNKRSTVLYKKDWHKGVVGIVASRLIEQKYQPTIVLTESNGKISGSARSIPGLNLFEALNACDEYLDTYGGHYFAAGLTLEPSKLDGFKLKFDEFVKSQLSDKDFIPIINIDSELAFKDITNQLYNLVHQMEPFGPHNMRPIFISYQVENYNAMSSIVKEKHIKFHLSQNGYVTKGIGFNLADKIDIVNSGKAFDVCYTLEMNTWNGISNVEIRVIDIRPSVN